MPRSFPIAFMLAAIFFSGPAGAQDMPKSAPKAQTPRAKAAEHVTDGEENAAGDSSASHARKTGSCGPA